MNISFSPTPVPPPEEQVRQVLALVHARMVDYLNAGVPRDQVTDFAQLVCEALKMAVTDGTPKAVEYFNTNVKLTFTHGSLR